MAYTRNKKCAASPATSMDEDHGGSKTDAMKRKSSRATEDWDILQDTVLAQEVNRVKQYMSTFHEKVVASRKKAEQNLRRMEEKRLKKETEFRDSIRTAVYGEDGRGDSSTSSAQALRAADSEVRGLLQALVARFEQIKEELRAQCVCECGTAGDDASRSLPTKAAWDNDHAEARRLLQYGRSYGESLVDEIIVPGVGTDKNGDAMAGHYRMGRSPYPEKTGFSLIRRTDSANLDPTGRLAVGLFPRSRALLEGGETWGQTVQSQVRALTGLIHTLPNDERGVQERGGFKTVTFMDC